MRINVTDLAQSTIESDVKFVHDKMEESSKLASALEFLSIVEPNIIYGYNGIIDPPCVYLAGEIEIFSTRADLAYETYLLTQQAKSGCTIL